LIAQDASAALLNARALGGKLYSFLEGGFLPQRALRSLLATNGEPFLEFTITLAVKQRWPEAWELFRNANAEPNGRSIYRPSPLLMNSRNKILRFFVSSKFVLTI
jgi:hypothetical protein